MVEGLPWWESDVADAEPTRFATAEAAVAEYLWSRAIEKAKSVRRNAALRRLGWEDDETWPPADTDQSPE
jgi:hypothetical protein